MTIWEYREDVDNYNYIEPAGEADPDLAQKLMGTPYPGPWTPIPVRYAATWKDPHPALDSQGKPIRFPGDDLPRCDFPALVCAGPAAVFSDRALQVLLPFVQDSVEVLSLECEDDDLHLINVIDVVDCLDEDESTAARLSNGAIAFITHQVFKEQLLAGKHIFKLPMPRVPIYVSDDFKAAVEGSGLEGLVWKPLR